MLLFSTMLDVKDSLTKDGFIQLVIDWNQGSPHQENIINGINWNGERNITFSEDSKRLEFQEYRNGNIIAARYEITAADGAVWDTDYVMNFSDMRMSVQLDRSFLAEALSVEPAFSAPHFITLLCERGYLQNDGILPVTDQPVFIDEDNMKILGGIVRGKDRYQFPAVYISKKSDNTDPVDVKKLAGRLKGVAHVLVQKGVWLDRKIRAECRGMNEFDGAAGIYFPNPSVPHSKFFCRAYSGYDERLFDRIVRIVINYANIQKIEPLYTWQGVNNAILREMRDEANDLVSSTDQEINDKNRQIEELVQQNERLTAENSGFRAKLSGIDSMPVLFLGSEEEFYPDEIKDILLSVLEDAAKNLPDKSRRKSVLLDIIRTNKYMHIQDGRKRSLKDKLKGYSTMTDSVRQFLESFGFTITEEGKHYRLTYYGDSRYHTTLSKSSSDKRSGHNAASEIVKFML